MEISLLCLLLSGAFGLVLNATNPAKVFQVDHSTANYGVKSDDASYQRTAPLVLIEPEAGCANVTNREELEGAIVLVKKAETCLSLDQALIIERLGGIGMVLGNNEGKVPVQMWKSHWDHRDVGIPCVSITEGKYTEIVSLLTAGSVIVTISKVGELHTSYLILPSMSQIVIDLLIVLPTVWFLLAMKQCCRRCSSNRRERRMREKRNREIPEILFTEDLLIAKSNSEQKSMNYLTNDSCPICLENFEERMKIKRLPCGHGYHDECIGPWLTNLNHDSCPICRQTVTDKLDEVDTGESSTCCFCCSETGEQDRRRLLTERAEIVVLQASSRDHTFLAGANLDLNVSGQGVQMSQMDESLSWARYLGPSLERTELVVNVMHLPHDNVLPEPSPEILSISVVQMPQMDESRAGDLAPAPDISSQPVTIVVVD